MNNIKTEFSIKDLENLSGIKAHTIRIWEKRYNLLKPNRTETNIRLYSLESLQKILNVSYLNSNGYKISKIAGLDEKEIPTFAREIASRTSLKNHAINSFKLAMMNFDQNLLYKTYNNLLQEKTFKEIFYDIFIPFLEELGMLWQTDTISPAHEHFITVFIKQKILVNIEKIQNIEPLDSSKTFVLYLPDNEIHDIGLLFINYELISKGYKSIFLGESVPMDSLIDLQKFYNNIVFISYFTVKPDKDRVNQYIQDFNNKIQRSDNSEFWILGKMLEKVDTDNLPDKVKTYASIENLVKEL